jgi:hypothetical protein
MREIIVLMGTTVGIGTMIAMIGIIIETGMAAAVTETIPEIIGTAEIRGTTGIEISVVAMIEIGGTDRLTEARSETHHSLCNTSHNTQGIPGNRINHSKWAGPKVRVQWKQWLL